MDSDLFLVIGMVLFILAIPALISAFSESNPPRMAAGLFLVGGTMIAVAVMTRPGGYAFSDVPGVVVEVIARIVN